MMFYPHLIQIEKELIEKGYKTVIPFSAEVMKKNNDFDPSHFKAAYTYEKRREIINRYFKLIAKGDAILVINDEKNGISGYIGANVLMEIALAEHYKRKVFILYPTVKTAPYNEELASLSVKFLDGDLGKMKL
jgi:hypothetical protein